MADLTEPFAWRVPAEFNIAADTCVQQRPQDLALVEGWDGGRRATFGQLARASARLANALVGLGAERGDRVAVILPQGMEVALAHLASYRVGTVTLPLSMLFREEALLARLRDSGARIVFADPSMAGLVGDLR